MEFFCLYLQRGGKDVKGKEEKEHQINIVLFPVIAQIY